MFKERLNAGYRIVDSVSVGSVEYVLAVHTEKPNMYVTWQCNGYDPYNQTFGYCWGHYFNDELAAKADLLIRALEAAEAWHYNRGGADVDINYSEIAALGQKSDTDTEVITDTGLIHYEVPPDDKKADPVRAEGSE